MVQHAAGAGFLPGQGLEQGPRAAFRSRLMLSEATQILYKSWATVYKITGDITFKKRNMLQQMSGYLIIIDGLDKFTYLLGLQSAFTLL